MVKLGLKKEYGLISCKIISHSICSRLQISRKLPNDMFPITGISRKNGDDMFPVTEGAIK